MRKSLTVVALGVLTLGSFALAQNSKRLNPLIDLLEHKQPLFGLYAPSAGRGGGGGRPGGGGGGAAGAAATPTPTPTTPPVPAKTPADLAKEALAQSNSDYIFSGGMEGSVERGLPAFTDLVNGLKDAGILVEKPSKHLAQPLVVKTTKFPKTPDGALDAAKVTDNLSKQLNTGVSVIVMVGVESAAEVELGLKAMRFKSKGGLRPDEVGMAPSVWGLSEKEYRDKADVWPLNKNGELLLWVIVESKEGLAHLKEIAAVKGISSLFAGYGTLGGVFSGDPAGREAAAAQILAACKERSIPCGFPAGNDQVIETRLKEGWSVFVINFNDAGFKAVQAGRQLSGRDKK